MALTVLIAGGGRVGTALATLLGTDEHEVTIVEPDPVRAGELRELLPRASVVVGDVTDPAVLESANVRTADAVAAVAGDDAANLIVASLAKLEFGVPRTIARIVDPANRWLYTESMGVDVPLDQSQLIAHLVAEEMSLGEMTTLVKLRRGRFSLVEERVHPASPANGRTIAELALPPDIVLVTVIRGEDAIAARGDVRLVAGDEVLAVVHDEAQPLHDLLRSR